MLSFVRRVSFWPVGRALRLSPAEVKETAVDPFKSANYTKEELEEYLKRIDEKYIPTRPNPTSLTAGWDPPQSKDDLRNFPFL